MLQLKAGLSEPLLIPVGTNHEIPRLLEPGAFVPPNLQGLYKCEHLPHRQPEEAQDGVIGMQACAR